MPPLAPILPDALSSLQAHARSLLYPSPQATAFFHSRNIHSHQEGATGTLLSGLSIVFLKPGAGPVLRYLSHPADLRLRQEIEISSDLKTWTIYRPTTLQTIASDPPITLKEATLPANPNDAPQFVGLRLELQVS
jgi:hypothetical protein